MAGFSLLEKKNKRKEKKGKKRKVAGAYKNHNSRDVIFLDSGDTDR